MLRNIATPFIQVKHMRQRLLMTVVIITVAFAFAFLLSTSRVSKIPPVLKPASEVISHLSASDAPHLAENVAADSRQAMALATLPLAIQSLAARGKYLVRGQVISCRAHAAIRAQVQLSETRTWSSPRDGTFVIGIIRPKAGESLQATVEAEGYESIVVVVPNWEPSSSVNLGTICLVPSTAITVHVLDAHGTAVSNAEVRAFPTDAAGGAIADNGTLLGVTDFTGSISARLTLPALIVAHKANLISPPVVSYSTANVTTVVVDDAPLVAVGSAGVRLPRIMLNLRGLGRNSNLRYKRITDDEGLIDPISPGDYALSVQGGSAILARSVMDLRESNWIEGISPSIYSFRAGESAWVEASLSAQVMLELVTTGTNIPLAQVQLATLNDEHVEAELASVSTDSGRLGLGWLGSDWKRLFLVNGAHLPVVVERAALEREGANTIVVPFDLAPLISLQVLASEGQPYLGSLYLREYCSATLSHFAPLQYTPDSAGRIASVPWRGGAIDVLSSKHSKRALGRLAETDVLREGPNRVLLSSTGSITLALPPDRFSSVVCLSEAYEEFHGVQLGSALIFDQLPAGRYLLDIPERIDVRKLRTLDSPMEFPLLLNSGDSIAVDWNAAWELPGSIAGRVVASGVALDSCRVLPLYGPPDAAVFRSALTGGVPVMPDGRFTIDSCSGYPDALVAVTYDPLIGAIPIGCTRSVRSGAIINVVGGQLRILRRAPDSEFGLLASFRPSIAGINFAEVYSVALPAGEQLLIPFLPSTCESISLTVRKPASRPHVYQINLADADGLTLDLTTDSK